MRSSPPVLRKEVVYPTEPLDPKTVSKRRITVTPDEARHGLIPTQTISTRDAALAAAERLRARRTRPPSHAPEPSAIER